MQAGKRAVTLFPSHLTLLKTLLLSAEDFLHFTDLALSLSPNPLSSAAVLQVRVARGAASLLFHCSLSFLNAAFGPIFCARFHFN